MIKNFQSKNLSLVYVLGILVLAFLLRVMFLGTIPNGFFPDEASNAYDAYSILHTLRDQYGEFFPAYFKSANDYREGLYMYFMVPFIKIFGLNIFGARITSAVIGTLTVLALYYLTQEIFNQRIALFSALFLAISPWHVHFSRITFRAILFPLLFCLTLLIFLRSFKSPKLLPLSGLLFAISIYSFFSARVFIPLFMIGLLILYRQHFFQHKKQTIFALILFLIVYIPQLIYQLSPEGMARANEVGLLENIPQIIGNYFAYFSPNFLFFKGDPILRHTIEKMGELYAFEIILLIIGFVGLVKSPIQHKGVLFLWLLLYPIPAALVTPGSAVRTCVGAPIFAIISGYGITVLFDYFQGRSKTIVKWITLLIIVANLTIFVQRYFGEYPKLKSDAWLPTLKEIITEAHQSNAECIVMSDNVYSKYAYILIPFYTQIPPAQYHRFGVDVVTDKFEMGRWRILDFEPYNIGDLPEIEKEFNSNCLYIIDHRYDMESLGKQGFRWQDVKVFKTVNDEQYYRLVRLSKD